MKKVILLAAFVLAVVFGNSQDAVYAKSLVDTLCSKTFFGRGYVNNGVNKAGDFLAQSFEEIGLKPIGSSYFQYFNFDVNTFPGKMMFRLGNTTDLKPGVDFMIDPHSGGIEGKFNWIYLPTNREKLVRQIDKWEQGTILVLPLYQVKDREERRILQQLASGFAQKYPVFMEVDEKFTWGVGRKHWPFPIIYIKKGTLNNITHVYLNIEQRFERNFESKNVIGMVPGTEHPDSFVVVSAHYDHLGGMGDKTYIPGASDNASGTAFIMDVAKHYIANPQPYSVVFMAFAGEEAGLLGSKYFVDNPTFALKNIKFVVNLDLMGDASKGITVVNGKVFEIDFKYLLNYNAEHDLLTEVKARGAAANSDHYWFSEKGVPSFFVYTMGDIKAYHDVNDTPEVVTYKKYNEVFDLITSFINQL